MTDASPPPAAETTPRARRVARRRASATRRVLIGLAIALIIVGIVLAVVYLNRRAAASQILTGWLDRRGIDADVEVDRIEIDGFVGRIRIGDPADPDFSVERVEVDYAVAGPWSSGGLGVTPSRIRLIRPILRATWTKGELSFGSLDPLVDELTGRPPRPDSTAPLVIVETGRLRLNTEYGPLQVLADARVEDGKLMRLHARMPAASLKSGDVEARGLGGALDLTTTGDRVALKIDAGAERFAGTGVSGTTARLSGTADLPYPDLKTRRGDGRAVLDLVLNGERLTLGPAETQGTDLRLAFDGTTEGWIETFRISGRTSSTVRAARLSTPGLDARGASIAVPNAALTLSRSGEGIGWRLDGPATVQAASATTGDMRFTTVTARSRRLVAGGRDGAYEASGPVALSARRFDFGDLSLTGATGALDLDATHDGATVVRANGRMRSSGGAWPLFGPIAPDDVPELAEMKRALGAFALDVPALRLITGSTGTELTLTRPARLTPANGGVLTINPVARPIYAAEPGRPGGGALTLTATRGRGLPEAAFAIPDWRLTPGGFEARLDGRAALDFGIGRGLTLTTSGLLANDTGRLTYSTDACIPFTADRLELEENDALDLSGTFCPPTGPLVVVEQGHWRAAGTFRDVAATAPFLAMQADQAQGTLSVTGSPAGLGMDADIASARVRDTTDPVRFNPLSASGQATLADERWSGRFDVARGPLTLGQVRLAHDGRAMAGGVTFDFPALNFAPGALQPADLSPLVAPFVQPPVTGSAAFTGRFDWTAAADVGTSSGVLTIPGLDFASPAGPVQGLSGTVAFSSLAPLVTEPGQLLKVARLDAFADFTDLDLTFGLDAAAITVGGGKTAFAGGTISVEPFAVPLDRAQPFSGVIVLDRVQLGQIVAEAGFGDKVDMDALVSGRLPFTSDPTGVRIIGGNLYAVQPGRLSIDRTALTGLSAGGGGAEVPPSMVQDLAYQAMENLAFDTLSAEVNSLDEGRIGVLFRIKGRHNPPQRQEIRLPLMDFISRRFMEQTLPLPSDTGIDLTLDTTLNLNQLIGDLLAVNRARAGEAAAAPIAPVPPPVSQPAVPQP